MTRPYSPCHAKWL